jgi:hypothetical protein
MKRTSTKHRRFGNTKASFYSNVKAVELPTAVNKDLQAKASTKKSKARKANMAVIRVPHKKATTANEIWSFDFVFDQQKRNNRSLKCLTIVDDCTKRSPRFNWLKLITARSMEIGTSHFQNCRISFAVTMRQKYHQEKRFMDWALS